MVGFPPPLAAPALMPRVLSLPLVSAIQYQCSDSSGWPSERSTDPKELVMSRWVSAQLLSPVASWRDKYSMETIEH